MKSLPNLSAIVNEIECWLAELETAGRSRRTIQTYRDALANLCRFLVSSCQVVSPVEILPVHLDAWQKHLADTGCGPACINLYVRAVQYWFDWQIKADRLFVNPATALKRPTLDRTLGRCPSIGAMRQLLRSLNGSDAISLRDRALLEVAYSTGARCEELVRLDDASVNLERRVVVIFGKGAKERVVPLTTAAANAVRDYRLHSRPKLLRGRSDQPALFLSSRSSRRLASFDIAGVVKRRGAAMGLTLSPHDLRRAFATHLALGGANIAHLRDLLGHVDYSHLRAYLNLAPSEMISAVHNSPLGQ